MKQPVMPQRAYRNFLLTILMVLLAFNFMDRFALGIVLQDIKVDLELSDTQLGLLTGIAFALFYSVMGIPIARWADRGNRVTIISLTAAVWSVAVASCGAAVNFLQLLLIRIVVATGEAGGIPPANSLIADYFPRAERPRAVGIYMMGAPLSLIFGFFAAGWLNQLYGWRATFIILGVPGLVLAVLIRLTLREPRQELRATQITPPRMGEVWRVLWRKKTFRHLLLCFCASHFFAYGVVQFQPAFFIRTYGLHTGEVGSWFAVSWGVCGLLGNYCGGALASRYAANNEPLQLRAIGILFLGFGAFSAGVYAVSNQYWAFGFLGLASVCLGMTNGPFMAMAQTLVTGEMRATTIAIMYLFANLIGMGFGPIAAGALSDALHPWLGDESLRFALLALCPGFLWCLWQMWLASATVRQDLSTMSEHLERDVSRANAGQKSQDGLAGISVR